MTTERQKMIDRRWNSCSVCGKYFACKDEVIYFQRCLIQQIPDFKSINSWDKCVITEDPTFQGVNLVQKISIHQQCFLEIAGDGFSFWEEDWNYQK